MKFAALAAWCIPLAALDAWDTSPRGQTPSRLVSFSGRSSPKPALFLPRLHGVYSRTFECHTGFLETIVEISVNTIVNGKGSKECHANATSIETYRKKTRKKNRPHMLNKQVSQVLEVLRCVARQVSSKPHFRSLDGRRAKRTSQCDDLDELRSTSRPIPSYYRPVYPS